MKKLFYVVTLVGLAGLLSGCYDPASHNNAWNIFIIGLGIFAGSVILFFIIAGIVVSFYKGKDVEAKVLKKLEAKVLRGNTIGRGTPGYKGQTDLSRRARRQKGRHRNSKILIELDGKEKTIRCSDNVLLDKLIVGRTNKIRIRFGEIVKILK